MAQCERCKDTGLVGGLTRDGEADVEVCSPECVDRINKSLETSMRVSEFAYKLARLFYTLGKDRDVDVGMDILGELRQADPARYDKEIQAMIDREKSGNTSGTV